MRLKDDSINPKGISPELVLGLVVANNVYKEEGVDLVITSLVDGLHSTTSLHYNGDAADLRIWNLKDPKETVRKIQTSLNQHYDVVLERDHIHLEYQPRQP